jgi:hypothetical protein
MINIEDIVNPETQPLFYVYSPSWRENAAGIRVLHYLCDTLNRIGCSAYLVLHNPHESEIRTNPKLDTPILNQELSDLHFESGRVPTVIYSETIPGNPLGASRVVRYLLNYVGVLGGPSKFDKNELLLSYTKAIQEATNDESSLLFLPAVKRDELPKVTIKNPNLNLMYAGKYRAFVGKPPKLTNVLLKEIYRDGPMKQSRAEVLNLLAEANSLYLWENSTIATEAILLGTPCIFIENDFLGNVIAGHELGLEGSTFLNTEEGIAAARNSLEIGKQKYLIAEENFWSQLHSFIQLHNQYFSGDPINPRRIQIPTSNGIVNRHRLRLFFGMLRTSGLRKTLRVTKEFWLNRFTAKD